VLVTIISSQAINQWNSCASFLRSIYEILGKVVERVTGMSFSGPD